MKRFLGVFLTAALAVTALTGCGSSGKGTEQTSATQTNTTQAEKTEKTVVSMTGWYDEANMKNIIDTINKQLGGDITVEYTFVNLQQYNNVLSTQLAAGEGPDILSDGASFPARIKAGNLVEITGSDYIKNFNEAGLSLCSTQGKVYGVPSYGWYSGLWYNKDIFEKNGVAIPETFDELVAACDKLSQNGVKPLGFGLSDGDTAWHSLVGFLENSFYNNGGPGKQFDSDFAFGKAKMTGTLNQYMDKWSVLVKKGYINKTMLGISNEQAVSDFVAGKTAMLNGGPWQYDTLKKAGINFAMISHLGSDKNNKWLVGGPAVSYGINKNSKNVEAAKKVLAAIASQEVQQSILDSNKGAFSYYVGLKPEIPAEYDAIKDVLSKGNVGVCWDRWGVNMPAQTLIDEAVKSLQGVVAGTLTTEQFTEALDAKADSIRYTK